MKRYFLIGEDTHKTEITAEEAAMYYNDSDYRIIIDGEAETAAHQAQDTKNDPEPDWEPFAFPEKPGYRLTSYVIWCSDESGEAKTHQVESVPEGAQKTAEPNVWQQRYSPLQSYTYKAVPLYEIIRTEAYGECEGCTRYTCSKRQLGKKCRNYKGRTK